MKYDEQAFVLAVHDYEQKLKPLKGKSVLIVMDLEDEAAFYSLAPLTRAIHNTEKDVYILIRDKICNNLEVIRDVWRVYGDIKKGIDNEKTEALLHFIEEVDKKAEGKFKKIFEPPQIIIEAKEQEFEGTTNLPYHKEWFKEHLWQKLIETAGNIWKNCFNLKHAEHVTIHFETIPTEKDLELPLEDYLDSYPIARAMMSIARKTAKVRMTASTSRLSILEPSERIGDLISTFLGCQLCKNIDEPVFQKYCKFADLIDTSRLTYNDAVFGIHGRGYSGKHIFGEAMGYPSVNKKTRWPTPGMMIYRFDWFPQTMIDKREPMTRLGFTQTIPIELFIETCGIDYKKMRKRNEEIRRTMDKCDKIYVVGQRINNLKTDFVVHLNDRWIRKSDSDLREKIEPIFFKKTGIKAGKMDNHPSGEVFATPEKIVGRIIGDVVICIDQSYRLDEKEPLVVGCDEKGYKVIQGPKKILKILKEKKEECWQKILEQQKNKSLPQDIINLKIKNFENIGEFAISTNPNAKLCDYLIVNEKIARMIHIALGSGFDADKNTEYHYDIVVNSPRQKLDIYGTDKKGKKLWIMKKGEFVV